MMSSKEYLILTGNAYNIMENQNHTHTGIEIPFFMNVDMCVGKKSGGK